MIEVRNVSKKYDVFLRKGIFKKERKIIDAVNEISFTINEGEIVGLLGFNGAGKTTLIKLMTGILVSTTGKISVNNYNPSLRDNDYLRSIGVLLGNRSVLFYDLPIKDSYDYLKSVYKLDSDDTNNFIFPLLEALSIDNLLEIPVRKLSLGQRRKAELVASIINRPKVLFLDEPTIGLDVISKKELVNFIKKLSEDYGTTIIYTSHDLKEIEECCSKIIYLENGRITYDGNTNQFKNKRNLFSVKITFNNKLDKTIYTNCIDDYTCYCLIEKDKLNEYINQFDTEEILSINTSEASLEDVVVNYDKYYRG